MEWRNGGTGFSRIRRSALFYPSGILICLGLAVPPIAFGSFDF